jgi:hypothetical protein
MCDLQVFLDAIGEDAGSIRRLGNRGIFEHRVLNRGHKGRDVDLVLLDERYERVPLPCHTRRDFCQPSVKKGRSREVRAATCGCCYPPPSILLLGPHLPWDNLLRVILQSPWMWVGFLSGVAGTMHILAATHFAFSVPGYCRDLAIAHVSGQLSVVSCVYACSILSAAAGLRTASTASSWIRVWSEPTPPMSLDCRRLPAHFLVSLVG